MAVTHLFWFVIQAVSAASLSASLALEPAADELTTSAPHKLVPLCSPDEELIEAHLGPNATAHLMRHQLKKLGSTPSLSARADELRPTDHRAHLHALPSVAHHLERVLHQPDSLVVIFAPHEHRTHCGLRISACPQE